MARSQGPHAGTVVSRRVNIKDPHGLARQGYWTKSHFEEAKKWGANVIRLPIHPYPEKREALWEPQWDNDWDYTLTRQGAFYKKAINHTTNHSPVHFSPESVTTLVLQAGTHARFR